MRRDTSPFKDSGVPESLRDNLVELAEPVSAARPRFPTRLLGDAEIELDGYEDSAIREIRL